MIKKVVKQFAIAAMLLITVACGAKEEKGWVVNGSIEGVTTGTLDLLGDYDMEKRDYAVENSYHVTDGKFVIKGGSVSEPTRLLFRLKSDKASGMFIFYVENGENIYQGKLNGRQIEMISCDGSIVNKHFNEYYRASKEKRLEFVKNNPSAYYAGEIIIAMATSGVSKEEQERLLAMLSPDINSSNVKDFREGLKKSVDMKVSDAISASNVSYKVDKEYDGTAFKGVKYLGVLSNGSLVALNRDKSLSIIDGNGKLLKSLSVSQTSQPATIAIDEKDNIFVLIPNEKDVKQNFRGKEIIKKIVEGYNCDIYAVDGQKRASFVVNGVKQATGARVADGKLMIADMGGRNIGIFNASTGVEEAEIKNMRPCCGILDFDINDKNELLVANLGAFRVQSYDLSGKQLLAFGSRGTGLDEFHGCCNPVSVAYLSNGAVVTVEKDPTRVKVYSKEGAKVIAGIDEMVKGCSYIPMTVDSKDNLYLASPTKGIVRCVAI